MKKRLFGISLLAISILVISSCSSGSSINIPKLEYENKLTKGNKVDSITLTVIDKQGVSNQVTISKDDKYEEMMQKLGYRTFAISEKKDGEFHPYAETSLFSNLTESINYPFKKVIKNSDGKIEELDEDTFGSKKTLYSSAANSTIYQYNYDDKSLFYIGNYASSDRTDYNLASGNASVVSNNEYFNRGEYYNINNSTDGWLVEYATNNEISNTGLYKSGSLIPDNIEKDYNSLYLETLSRDAVSYDNLIRYKDENNDIYFNLLYGRYPRTFGITGDYYSVYCNALEMHHGNLSYVPKSLLEFYDFSFELTDKYIIIKNRINTSREDLEHLMQEREIKEEYISELKSIFNGSYEYKEVWLDYKNYEEQLLNSTTSPNLGFAYAKMEYVFRQESSSIWKEDDAHYYCKDGNLDRLEKLGLIGKKRVAITKYTRKYEAYIIDVDEDTINDKKNDFISKCKENNFFDKYNFRKVSDW